MGLAMNGNLAAMDRTVNAPRECASGLFKSDLLRILAVYLKSLPNALMILLGIPGISDSILSDCLCQMIVHITRMRHVDAIIKKPGLINSRNEVVMISKLPSEARESRSFFCLSIGWDAIHNRIPPIREFRRIKIIRRRLLLIGAIIVFYT
jgi:hypothetical protein